MDNNTATASTPHSSPITGQSKMERDSSKIPTNFIIMDANPTSVGSPVTIASNYAALALKQDDELSTSTTLLSTSSDRPVIAPASDDV